MPSIRIRLLFSLLLLLGSRSADGNPIDSTKSVKGRTGISFSGTYGFLIAHRDALLPLQQEHLSSIEASIYFTAKGEKPWERTFLLPEKGIHAAWLRPGSKDRLGNAIAVYPYFDFPLSNRSSRHLWFRYGIGLGYVEHVFDATDNFRNVAIGSHLNGVIHFGLDYRIRMSRKSSMAAGIQLTHFSNGSFRMPNLGINLPAVSIAYRFGGTQNNRAAIKDSASSYRPATISIMGAFGIKETYPIGGRKYQTTTLSGTYFFGSQKKHDWGIGMDLFYDNSLATRNKATNGDSTTAANFRPGIHGAWQLKIDRLGLLFNMGFYPYTVFRNDGYFYHRVGLRYDFGRLFACMQLKTHYARADYVEWGLGWNFQKKIKE